MQVADDVLVQEERTAGEEVPQEEKEERAGIRTQVTQSLKWKEK